MFCFLSVCFRFPNVTTTQKQQGNMKCMKQFLMFLSLLTCLRVPQVEGSHTPHACVLQLLSRDMLASSTLQHDNTISPSRYRPLGHIQNQTNPVHTLSPYFFKPVLISLSSEIQRWTSTNIRSLSWCSGFKPRLGNREL